MEFPGGKIEEGESEIDCIKGEINEELNTNIEVLDRLTPSIYKYPNFTIELIPFTANYVSGELKLKEHLRYLLLDKEKMDSFDWYGADLEVVDEVLRFDCNNKL